MSIHEHSGTRVQGSLLEPEVKSVDSSFLMLRKTFIVILQHSHFNSKVTRSISLSEAFMDYKAAVWALLMLPKDPLYIATLSLFSPTLRPFFCYSHIWPGTNSGVRVTVRRLFKSEKPLHLCTLEWIK